ncbi:MAG: hypothetical protein Q8N63_06880 [Nanoarchaeota archaeon]|nr:hypothetical protein [Nanoarchaeota archaeon]
MEAILNDIYLPPVYGKQPKPIFGGDQVYEQVEISPARINTCTGECLTKEQLEFRLSQLKFGDKKQVRALELLQFLEDCEGETEPIFLV